MSLSNRSDAPRVTPILAALMASTVAPGYWSPAAAQTSSVPATSGLPSASNVPSEDDQTSVNPAEVVVTAQKRTERLQDVPVSIAVLDSSDLTAFGSGNATDIGYRVPNVSLTNSAGPRSFGFFIRGIGTTSFAVESVESSTAYVVDGVVLGLSGSSLTDLPDLERVEVLRGPQGTLFGKNASAGVINVITKRPSSTLEGLVRASVAGPHFERRISGYISGPISEQVRFSLSARVNKQDGFVTNRFDGRKFNDENNMGVRGKLEVSPSNNLRLTLIGDWWRRRADCCLFTLVQAATPPVSFESAQIAAGININDRNSSSFIDGNIFADVDSHGFSTQADYDIGEYTLTSISAYRRFKTLDGLDQDSSPADVFNVNYADLKQSQFSQELRIASPKGGFIDYVAGLYYFKQNVKTYSAQRQPASRARLANRDVYVKASTESLAIFSQANINFTPYFRAIVGGRLLKEKYFADKVRTDPVLSVTESTQAAKDDTAFVWRLGLQYDFSRNLNVFATTTRGYKGGGYDTGIGFLALASILPERPTLYEVGFRSSAPDLGLVFNVTGFSQRVKDFQVNARDPIDPSVFRLLNAATAKSDGVEVEVTWRPSRDIDLALSASGAYANARFGTFTGAPCTRGQTVAVGCVGGVQNLSGAQLPFSQKWTGNLGVDYRAPVGSVALVLNGNLNHRSKSFQSSPNDPFTIQRAFSLINLAAAVEAADARWKVGVFVRNLTDQGYNTRKFSTPLGGVGSYAAYIPYEARRITGVQAELRF